MPPTFIPFDGWSPGGGYFGEGWASCNNLMPFYSSWRPLRQFVPVTGIGTGTTFGPMTGAHSHFWMSGGGTSSYVPDDTTLFAGSKTRLFTVSPSLGTFTDVSRAANYGAGAGTEPAGWRFASVGNDIFATNWFDPVQRRTNNAGLFANAFTSAFTPVPRHLATIREHLVGANLSNAGRFQDEVVWSDADNAINFDPPSGTSTSIAGSKRLFSVPGQLTGLIGGQYGIAFKRLAIYYLEYTSTTQVFRPDVLSSHVGTAYSSSIINTRYGVFFLGPDGFYQIAGLSEPVKISPPGIDQFLLDTNFSFQGNALTASLEDTQAVGFHWPGIPLIGWLYRTDWSASGNTACVLYNPVERRWASGAVDLSGATVLPSMMSVRPYASTVWNPVAALTWNGSESRYAPLDHLGTTPRAPSLELRYRPAGLDRVNHQQQSIVSGVMPLFSKTTVDAASLTESVTVSTLLDPHNDVWKTEGPRLASERDTVSGMFPFQATGRFFKITITCAAEDFANFEGVFVDQRLLS